MNQLVNEAFVLAYSHQLRGVLTRARLQGVSDKYIDELTLLARLVDFTLITKDDLQKTNFTMNQLIDDVRAKSIDPERIIFKHASNIKLYGDAELITHMLHEIIRNALVYSDKEVVVSAHRYKKGAVFRIEDQGPGISERERKRILEPFYRGKAAAKSGRPGYGLGLSAAQAIAIAHQGEVIVAESSPKGATILVALYITKDRDFSPQGIEALG